jgi:hypothetical protein
MKTGALLCVAVSALSSCRQAEVKPSEDRPAPAAATPAATVTAPGEGRAGGGQLGMGGVAGGPMASLLLPPGTPGESRVKLEGCLAQTEATEAAGSRFPSRAGSRSASPGPEAQVSTVQGGVLITHPLSHACCLTAAVTSKVEGAKVTVRETLSGSPCRCLCESTVRTAVGLSKGHYQLSLVQESGGAPVSVLETEIDVP